MKTRLLVELLSPCPTRSHDANHFEAHAVQQDRVADSRSSGKQVLQHLVAEQRDHCASATRRRR